MRPSFAQWHDEFLIFGLFLDPAFLIITGFLPNGLGTFLRLSTPVPRGTTSNFPICSMLSESGAWDPGHFLMTSVVVVRRLARSPDRWQ